VGSLLQHLSSRLVSSKEVLEPDQGDEDVHRAIQVLKLVLRPAAVKGEAWEAVMRTISTQRTMGDSVKTPEHIIARIVSGWIRTGGATGMSIFDL
jgi:hypothetical protein